ncbi:type ISP restriction/modification enzyme [Neorhizobium sp. Rsf11]|uniref:Type ISP restriction/modification enzyme n=1 Tax=Neorhizobium phenanthreniclasticum TaxID=3157917 RepID=A0ABV0M6L5_9HYPH
MGSQKLSTLAFERIEPDKKGNWVNLAENQWDELTPVADKKTKSAKTSAQQKALFKLFSLGVKTNRDDWVTDYSQELLGVKTSALISAYEAERNRLTGQVNRLNVNTLISYHLKWTRKLKRLIVDNRQLVYSRTPIRSSLYRPYSQQFTYFDSSLNEDWYQLGHITLNGPNPTILLSGYPSQKPFQILATADLWHHDTLDKTNGLPLYRYTSSGERVDNITDWGLKQFQSHYGKAEKISKEDIFHYVYGVLHDPVYREKYALNLKREFPRIPFYPDFRAWADWGKRLMELHIGYETVEPWPLERLDTPDEKARAAGVSAKAILKADKENGIIRLDSETQLSGIPAAAWTYRLGNRSGLEWILDQYREKTPKDPTIREKFNTYRFADYKEKVIDLLMRVTRVSVETVAITEAMKSARRATEDAA